MSVAVGGLPAGLFRHPGWWDLPKADADGNRQYCHHLLQDNKVWEMLPVNPRPAHQGKEEREEKFASWKIKEALLCLLPWRMALASSS